MRRKDNIIDTHSTSPSAQTKTWLIEKARTRKNSKGMFKRPGRTSPKIQKKVQKEIKEAFDKKISEWTVGRVSTVIVVSGVLLALAVGLLRWLLI